MTEPRPHERPNKGEAGLVTDHIHLWATNTKSPGSAPIRQDNARLQDSSKLLLYLLLAPFSTDCHPVAEAWRRTDRGVR